MNGLERAQLTLMRIHGAVLGLVLLGGAAAGEAVLRGRFALPAGALLVPALLAACWAVLVAPARRYRAWGYAVDEEELRVRRGVWTRVQTLVPLDRVQHIDIAQGPLERALRICRLVLHTAGTVHSQVIVPGLSRETAEAMRDEIRARIRQAGS